MKQFETGAVLESPGNGEGGPERAARQTFVCHFFAMDFDNSIKGYINISLILYKRQNFYANPDLL